MINTRVYFYDENKNIKYYNLISPLTNYGTDVLGNAYRVGPYECLKIVEMDHNYDLEALKMIRDAKLPKYYEIHDFLFKRLSLLADDERLRFNAYTSMYYPSGDINILEMPTEYTLDNFTGIDGSLEKIAKMDIRANDLNTSNVILGIDKMTMIDIDLYFRNHSVTEEDKRKVSRSNHNQLLKLFKELYIEARSAIPNYYEVLDDAIITDLFYQDTDTESVVKKLSRYKYPIDYLTKTRKRCQ